MIATATQLENKRIPEGDLGVDAEITHICPTGSLTAFGNEETHAMSQVLVLSDFQDKPYGFESG